MDYNVTLQTPDGTQTIQCEDDQYILDNRREQRYRHVILLSCMELVHLVDGKIVSGTVDNSDQSFLDDEQVDEGWVLTCVHIQHQTVLFSRNRRRTSKYDYLKISQSLITFHWVMMTQPVSE